MKEFGIEIGSNLALAIIVMLIATSCSFNEWSSHRADIEIAKAQQSAVTQLAEEK